MSVLAPTLSAFAAISALAISLWVAHEQRKLSRSQLKHSYFEKRYAVFRATEDFLNHVLRVDGSLKLVSDEFRTFHYALEQAEFLFGPDVVGYMNELKKTVVDIHPQVFERDHLALMKLQKLELDTEITAVLMRLAGPLTEKRKQVFGPYLQLSPSETKGSAAPMKLIGWQRLWVVLAVLWLLPVTFFTYEYWPRTADLSKTYVYMEMKADDGNRLLDYWDVVATALGGTNEGPTPLITRLRHDKGFLSSSPEDQRAYLLNVDPDFKKASPTDQNAYLGNITGRKGPSREVDGNRLEFVADVKAEEINKTTEAYDEIVRRNLMRWRASVFAKAFACWAIPVAALYALGWAFWWVRRGFYRTAKT